MVQNISLFLMGMCVFKVLYIQACSQIGVFPLLMLIQEKQTENKKLQQRIDQMEKSVRDMQDKFEYAHLYNKFIILPRRVMYIHNM